MKKLAIALCLAITFAVPVLAQDPCSQTTALSNPSRTITSNGMGNLSGSGATQIHYEMWTDGGQTGNNKLSWYGSDKGGGAAFKAEWANPNDYLGRVGYYWGNGSAYTAYKNIYVDFNYKGKKTGSGGNYSYIGIYGWARNSSASDNNRKLIEYYIIDDWFGNGQLGTATTGGSKVGEYTLDGGTYYVITNIRQNKPSIDGDKTFTQYFSIRQGMGSNARQCGTYSVTEHFKKWEGLNLILGNMYEAKFLVEAGGGTGSVDLTYLKFSQEDQPRSGTGGGASSSSTGGSATPSSSSAAKTQATTCKTPLITYPTSTVPSDPYTACFKYTNNKCYVCKISSEGEFEGNVNTCASGWVWDGTQIASNLENGYWYQEVTCPATSSSSAAVSSSSIASSSSVAVSSSSRPSSSSAAVSSSSIASSSSAVASSSSMCPPGGSGNGCSPAVPSSSSRASSSSAGTTPILANHVPVTYFSVQTMSEKALRIEISSPSVVEIFDQKGNKVASFDVYNTLQTVKLSLPNGVYFAKVRGMKSIRFVLK